MHTQILHDATGLNQVLRSRRKDLGLTQEELGKRAASSTLARSGVRDLTLSANVTWRSPKPSQHDHAQRGLL